MVQIIIYLKLFTIYTSQGVTLINPRRACARVIVVVFSVCLSVKSHLTSGASVRPENAVKYSVCNVGGKSCRNFSETISFQSYRTSCIVRVREVGHFLSGNTRVSPPSYGRYQRL